jgi:hypothetical protein
MTCGRVAVFNRKGRAAKGANMDGTLTASRASHPTMEALEPRLYLATDPLGHAPVAQNLSVRVTENKPYSGRVAATDSAKDTMTYLLMAPPSHGTLTFNSSGTFVYTPATDWIGIDSFTFRADDGRHQISLGDITVGPGDLQDDIFVGTQSDGLGSNVVVYDHGTVRKVPYPSDYMGFVVSQVGTRAVLATNGWTDNGFYFFNGNALQWIDSQGGSAPSHFNLPQLTEDGDRVIWVSDAQKSENPDAALHTFVYDGAAVADLGPMAVGPGHLTDDLYVGSRWDGVKTTVVVYDHGQTREVAGPDGFNGHIAFEAAGKAVLVGDNWEASGFYYFDGTDLDWVDSQGGGTPAYFSWPQLTVTGNRAVWVSDKRLQPGFEDDYTLHTFVYDGATTTDLGPMEVGPGHLQDDVYVGAEYDMIAWTTTVVVYDHGTVRRIATPKTNFMGRIYEEVGQIAIIGEEGPDAGGFYYFDGYNLEWATESPCVTLNMYGPELTASGSQAAWVVHLDSWYEGRHATYVFDEGLPASKGTVTLNVRGINHAPVLDNSADLALADISEDDVANAGTRVSDILAGAGTDPITDVDEFSQEGIAVIGADASHGAWQYSLDGGTTWLALGAPSAAAARLIGDDGRLRFVPAANYSGTVSGGITFRAWDQITGTAGKTVNLTAAAATGGTTAFSTATETAAITVGPVNDGPAATPQPVVVDAGQDKDVALAGTDVETAAASLVFNIVTPPEHGELTPGDQGHFTYKPDDGYLGPDSFTFTVTDDGDPAGSHADPADLTSDPAAVTLWVGRALTFDSKHKATFLDSPAGAAPSDSVTFSMTGPGSGTLYFMSGAPTLASDATLLVLDGTTSVSAVTVATKAGATGVTAHTSIGAIDVRGPLGTLTAATTSLNGNMTVAGTVGKVTLDELTGGGAIQIGGDPMLKTGAKIVFGRVKDTNFTSTMPLASLSAKEWLDTDATAETISAPRIGTFLIYGDTVKKIRGDLGANLVISGKSTDGTGKTLATATVKGFVAPSVWDVTGKVGTVTINGTVGAAGRPWEFGTPAALTTMTLGDVADAQVKVAGDVGSIKAVRWLDGSIQAPRISSIKTTGLAATKTVQAISGDFGADITLTHVGTTYVLNTLSIAGWLTGSMISSTGSVMTVTLGGMQDSTLAAGDLVGVQKKVATLTVKGIKGAAASVINSNVAAWTLGTVSLVGVQTVNAGHLPAAFGIQGHTITSYVRDARKYPSKGSPGFVIDQADDYTVALV